MSLRKDEILDRLAKRGNVAQFVGFEPSASGPRPTYARVEGRAANDAPADPKDAVAVLFAASAEQSINVRSYAPNDPRSREFIYGIKSPADGLAAVERLTAEGLHTIANETIDVADGGVSGVIQGGVIEFSPDDTPRCVERAGTVALPAQSGLRVLETVYGFRPDLRPTVDERTEFSIHPRPRGWRKAHTLLWEHEMRVAPPAPARVRWPNNFSRMMGDKAFGLLMAEDAGLPVPYTLVVGRRLAPFSFGSRTGSSDIWTRTCPVEPQPGLFTTLKGWTDPFTLFDTEDPDRTSLASLLRQDAVPAQHSGAAIVTADGALAIEGTRGEGDGFMLGTDGAEQLPTETIDRVRAAYERLADRFGAVRFEWVDDGAVLWLVQLHVGATQTLGRTVVAGDPGEWINFDVRRGLPELRATLAGLSSDTGIVVIGGAGLTSHIADVLRKAGRPAQLSGI